LVNSLYEEEEEGEHFTRYHSQSLTFIDSVSQSSSVIERTFDT